MDIGVLRRDGRTDPFFDGTAADRLMIKRCDACGRCYAPDASDCTGCGAADLTWAEATGHATLVSWAVSHAGASPPALLALVELSEGPWLYTRLDGVERASLRTGLPLHARFEHPDEGESYVVFRPA